MLLSTTAYANPITSDTLSVALSKHSCNKVTRSMYMGKDADAMLYYSAKCSNGAKYIVQINAFSKNISTRVLECNIAKRLGIKCFKKLS
jgi:hypothetical protein